jgi:hypothetical protein
MPFKSGFGHSPAQELKKCSETLINKGIKAT